MTRIDEPLEEILGVRRRRTRLPLTRRLRNSPHQITQRAWTVLCGQYSHADLTTRLLQELERLAPIATVAYQQQCVLVTSYTFDARNGPEALQYRPNKYGGITIMLPGDA